MDREGFSEEIKNMIKDKANRTGLTVREVVEEAIREMNKRDKQA